MVDLKKAHDGLSRLLLLGRPKESSEQSNKENEDVFSIEATIRRHEAELQKLLAATPSTRAPSFSPPRRAATQAVPGVHEEVQTDPLVHPPEVMVNRLPPEPSPMPPPRRPQRRILVQPEDDEVVEALRQEVSVRRKELEQKDNTVTGLVQKLKQSRAEIWNCHAASNASDFKVNQILKREWSELPKEFQRSLQSLSAEESEVATEYGEARADSARWAAVAKRQDSMLAEEREAQKGGDIITILAKHPSGEVFLAKADSDSEDDFRDLRERRTKAPPPRVHEDVSLESDDDPPPKQTPPQQRLVEGLSDQDAADADDSYASSFASPSGESNSGKLEKQTEATSSTPTPNKPAASQVPVAGPGRDVKSITRVGYASKDSDSSDSEDDVRQTVAEPKVTTSVPKRPFQVPVLPDLVNGLASKREVMTDEVAEISSDEILSSRRSI
jgi:hypothetical protein